MPNVIVTIPWRPEPTRIPLMEAVMRWYGAYMPGVEVVPIDSGHPRFNRSASRNAGVRMAKERGADVVILNDADTIPQIGPLQEAINDVRDGIVAHLPYTECRIVNRPNTDKGIRRGCKFDGMPVFVMHTSTGGTMVTTPDIWASHGGQDEGFKEWGYEDAAWAMAHNTLLGPYVRHEGHIYSLNHDTALKAGPNFQTGVALIMRYQKADGDPVKMRELVFGG